MKPNNRNLAARGGGYSITNALVAVVVLGIGATVAIPRVWLARSDALDKAVIEQIHATIAAVDQYKLEHNQLPQSPGDAGVSFGDDIEISMWVRQVVGGVESVHMHVRHLRTDRTFHANYPYKSGVLLLPPAWDVH